ncbi:GreA/GreB family elongation factor [Burkholderia sp. NRF60-BP8]|uniref:GreA/GreB family elongation factor n=1 Tax=Burkholderia sp. NRF60-BP8 TaxID=1637853 RepID=UPI00075BF3CD|nr:GreA/GreB family elongation factor [Burkholderia sp. NRF60-BP8]AOI74945.1 transcription elongation factor GreAB [Burkholderia sp. NRF60-BP8]KVA04086.1 transcription elongation factor GreAB [Burkholderia sp. NRF60-BP8]
MNTAIAQLSESDVSRLERVSARDSRYQAMLDELLERADIVAPRRIQSDVVTMNSSVTLTDPVSEASTTWTIAYPDDARFEAGLLNVFSPVGMALLGARQGDRVSVSLPDGTHTPMTITRVEYQPEASWA